MEQLTYFCVFIERSLYYYVIKGLKKGDTSILQGYQIYHNYIRGNEGLEGKIPAEAYGIKVEGNCK